MKKLIKYFLGIIVLLFLILFILDIFIFDRSIPQPALGHLDAVMVDNEIYFYHVGYLYWGWVYSSLTQTPPPKKRIFAPRAFFCRCT